MVMDVKKVISDRLERARVFSDNVRAVYEVAYDKAMEVRKGGVSELVSEIQPRVRAAVEEGLHGAQTVFDELNQSLADKAIPAFRKGTVLKSELQQKSKQAVSRANKAKPTAAEK